MAEQLRNEFQTVEKFYYAPPLPKQRQSLKFFLVCGQARLLHRNSSSPPARQKKVLITNALTGKNRLLLGSVNDWETLFFWECLVFIDISLIGKAHPKIFLSRYISLSDVSERN